ncbi:carbohydrate ABC transporter membrane protein 1, CUT1 family [[Leptolyngbya] sp. PCC 7376]|uniref:carbohydrate ABC transporter permease n=1 Tax=[Leptolyngbya] sp. PCC 7376 TaxID=111781 RepID=UPI00029F1113|nr:sugar ABC transporter permease [[Leptolyngbya] sp. PCC 7376]AFY38200.1 carbohydrate ABC transporter membrane protein 1, CUT1 family [[Leptolyngbya] sp. PCC 7376]
MKSKFSFATPYLFLFPALAILGLTVALPAVQAFYLSFTEYQYDLTQTPQWVGFKNFSILLKDQLFWKTLGNTVLYLIGVVPLLVSLSLGLAITVNQKLRGITWFRAAYYTPVIVSLVVAGIAWKALYASNGFLNQLLKQVGFTDNILPIVDQLFPKIDFSGGIPWLTDPTLAIWSVMLVTIWKGLGYYMVIYLAGLQSISPELYEAASLDGSDGWRKHLDITVPLMRPYILLVSVISAISATKVFEEIFVMTQGGPLNASKTVVYYLYEQAFQNLEISYACTIGLVLFLFIFILSIFNLYLSRQTNQPL